MVNNNHKETEMTTYQHPVSTGRRTASTAIASLLSAAALLSLANPASALPPGGGADSTPLFNAAPVARFYASPNPAVLNPSLVVGPVSGSAVKALVLDLAPGAKVEFNGSTSSDADGSVAKYQWDFDGNGTYDATSTTSATASKRFLAPGTYNVRLRVTDDEGAADIVDRPVVVHRAPRAVIAATPSVVLVGQQANLSAVGSTDDNGIARYDWDLDGNGSFETAGNSTPTASTSYTTLGTRSVKVRVRDIYGVDGVAAINIIVHRAPTAAFTFAPSPPFAGERVTFDGSSSGDDGMIKKYEWDLDGNGTFETDTQAVPTASKVYDAPETISVRLRVTDDHGVQDVISHAVAVTTRPAAGAAAMDATAPNVRISPRVVRVSRTGMVTLKVTCPRSERSCIGRLTLRSARLGGKSVGSRAFRLGGGQTATVRIKLSRAARQMVKRNRKLGTNATATARDADGNAGTSRALVTIKR